VGGVGVFYVALGGGGAAPRRRFQCAQRRCLADLGHFSAVTFCEPSGTSILSPLPDHRHLLFMLWSPQARFFLESIIGNPAAPHLAL
jgi:hypothetical protein